MRVRLITNPNASGVTERIVSTVATRLTAVCDLEIAYTDRQGHATDLAAEVAEGAVVSLGGDGTVNEVVNGLRPGVALGVLPGGASSIYARQLGFPDDPARAAGLLAAAIRAGSTRTVGLGVADGRRFTFAASVGFDADATRVVDEARRNRPGGVRPNDIQVLMAALRVLGKQRFRLDEQMTVTADGSEPIRASYIAIANQHPYTYFGKIKVQATPRASFDSALDAVVLGNLSRRGLPRLAVYALIHPLHARRDTPGITYLHDQPSFVIECDHPVAVQIDGEYVGDHARVTIGYEPAAIDVYVPAG